MKGKRFVRILGASSLFAMTISAILALWTSRAETFAHYRPEYAKIELLPILQKDELTEEDYSILFRQTGLARAGIDELRASGQQEELLYLQQRYFANPEIECLHNNLFIRSERLVKDKGTGETSAFSVMPVGAALSAKEPELDFASLIGKLEPTAAAFSASELSQKIVFSVNEMEWNTVKQNIATAQTEKQNQNAALSVVSPSGVPDSFMPFPTVQTGDILITYSGHIFGWRSGHAAIVTDAERQLTLEAITMGCDSRICSLADWEEYPSVALLRLKDASPQERQQIAAYAEEHLQGLPYSLAAFTKFDDATEKPSDRTVAAICFGALGQAVQLCVSSEKNGAKEQKNGSSIIHDLLARSIICGIHQEAVSEDDASEKALCRTGTQCAHLVWYAYRYFGYDLDSDGGFVVTPDDLYHSDLLELVQIYGIPPNY